jgi:hypothetical protein
MQFNESRLNAAIETAKAKADGNRAILNAIEKAAAGLRGGWIVTELVDGLLITSDSGETYHANGTCSCAAYRNGMVCKHRVAYRLLTLYNASEPVATKEATSRAATSCSIDYEVRAPRVVRSVERDIITHHRVVAVSCDNWLV